MDDALLMRVLDGLADLGEQLEALLLNSTDITDAGVKHLARFQQLKVLELRGTRITNGGLEDLRKALPETPHHERIEASLAEEPARSMMAAGADAGVNQVLP